MKKYEKVIHDIKQSIISGQYGRGTILPDQKQLAKNFNVSTITIKKALDSLANNGYILKKSGFGTVVIGPTTLITDKDAPANNFDGLTKQEGANRISSKIITFNLDFPSKMVQQNLNIDEEEPVYHIVRLRLLDGEPFILENTYMPVNLIPGLTQSVLEGSIYSYIQDKLHLNFAGISRKIQARSSNNLDQRYLNVGTNDAMLEVEQIVWLVNGTPIEYSTSRNASDRRSYYIFDAK